MRATSTAMGFTRHWRWAVLAASFMAMPAVWAVDGHDHGAQGGADAKESGGKGGGMKQGMMMGHKSGGGHEKSGCPGQDGMPPHYCAPDYKISSAVPGVALGTVAPAGDRAVMVTLKELNVMTPGIKQNLVLVAGGKDLAGAAVVKGGWKGNTDVHLNLTGTGSLHEGHHLYVKVFPITAE